MFYSSTQALTKVTQVTRVTEVTDVIAVTIDFAVYPTGWNT